MGKASSGTKQQVTQYNASIHFGICSGPVDYISGIYVNEKEAWAGEQSVQGTITISDKMELFGGDKKEGGVQGIVEYLPGASDQTISEILAGKVGLTTATMPAYRGITTAWFYGRNLVEPEDEGLGFYWTANSPYLPGVWIKVARASTQLNEVHSRIYRSATGEAFTEISLDLGTLGTGNRSFKWDTNGDYLIWGEGGSGAVVYTLPEGTSDIISTLDVGGSAVHINDHGELLIITEGILSVWNIAADDLQDMYEVDNPGLAQDVGFVMDDITIGSQTFHLTQRFMWADGDNYFWQLYTRESNGEFGIGSVVLATNHLVSLSMGPQYGYGIPGDGAGIGTDHDVDTTSVVRVDWTAAFSESLVDLSATLTDFIAVCHYDDATGYVIIICQNGDIFQFSADLTTLINSNLGAVTTTIQTDALLSKRLKVTPTTFAFRDTAGAIDNNTIYTFSSSDLSLVSTVSPDGYPNEGTAFGWTAFNSDHNGVFLPSHGLPSAFWFLGGGGPFDSNPAHIIYDSLTNTDWGMGAAASAIDFDSFTNAGATLFAENFGLSMMWTKQSTIEAFISEVIDHIEATLFVSPLTGLLTLKLIRDDYSITGLPEFTPDNSVVTNWQRKLWGETVNEIVVSWTNPENEETETVVAQDNANIAAQGGIVSDGRNYYGVRVKELAIRLAQRDLRAASTPLASCDIEVNREAWALLPGDVVILNSPEDDIVSIVMRVGPVDYGKPGDPTVKAALVEDVWALPLADYTVPPDTLAEDTAEAPTPADDTLVFTLPYFVTVNKIDPGTLSDVEYPEVFAGILASEDGRDTSEFELLGEVTGAGGTVAFANIGTKSIASRGTLPDAIDAEVETTIVSFPDRTQGHGPRVGGFMLIEGDDETEHELCLVTEWGGSPTAYTFQRGALDTVPQDWPAGTPVWFFDESMVFTDATIRSEAETVDYKVLIRTSLGLLPQGSAPTISETLTARPHLPLRPADVTVNGDDGLSSILDLTSVDPIPTTWARRNRLTEDAVVLAWDAGDVTPEAGQTTTVRLTDLAGVMLHEYTGIAGTSQDVDPADFGTEAEGYIEFVSVRDGMESLQGYRVRVIVAGGGLFEFEDGTSYEFEDDEPKLFED